jgi:TBC1 domain family member 10
LQRRRGWSTRALHRPKIFFSKLFFSVFEGDIFKYIILKVLDPEIGYCQAQAPLAAFLLMHMPAEQAFWCLVSVCHKYLNGYYSHGMQQLQLDGDILFGLVKKVAPQVYRHLVMNLIDM